MINYDINLNEEFLEVINRICRQEVFNPGILSDSEITYISNIKRFSERWRADPSFRKQVCVEPYQTIIDYGIKLEPEEIGHLLESNFAQNIPKNDPIITRYEHWKKIVEQEKPSNHLKSAISSLPNLHFKTWRERQIARTTSQFKKWVQDSIPHFTVSLELNKGCSVGCAFCGVSAPSLSDIFYHNQENAQLWREILEVLKEILGSAAGVGFCYWATEPMDNPDYENFCSDFHEILGFFPQTTTAQPLKNPDRTRALLKLSREKKCHYNRFSILSLKMLDLIHKEFTAEELAFVQLELHNKEAKRIKASAGRSREKSTKKPEQGSELSEQGTIACISGFLFNMVDRSVKLISPCNASERWPNGYIVYAQETFTDAEDLKIILGRMIEDNMPLTIRPEQLVAFRPDLNYESLPDGFRLSNRLKTYNFRHEPQIKELGDLISRGDKTAQEIVTIFKSSGVPLALIFHHLNLMFEKGILDEEPKAPKISETTDLAVSLTR